MTDQEKYAVEMTEAMMAMLKNKPKVLSEVLSDFDRCRKLVKGMPHASESVSSENLLNLEDKLRLTMKVCGEQAAMIEKLIMVLVPYLASSSFDSDAASCLNKLGRGQEALQELMRQKMS